MRCTHCGNEIASGVKFCGKCGEKVEGELVRQKMEQPIQMQTRQPLNQTFMQNENSPISQQNVGVGVGGVVQGNRSSGFPFGKILLLVIILVAGFFVYKEVNKRFLSPVGVWTSADSPVELQFEENGTFQIGAYGTFMGNLHWKKESMEKYYLSGQSPEVMGMSLGEIGCYAYLDIKEKTLRVDFGFGELLFRKNE